MLLALLLACTPPAADSVADEGDACAFGPTVEIVSPADGATFYVGEPVTLEAAASSRASDEQFLLYLWEVATVYGPHTGETESPGTGATTTWTPSYDAQFRIVVQVGDACTEDPDNELNPTQADVVVTSHT